MNAVQDKYAPLKRMACRPQSLTTSHDGNAVYFLRDTDKSTSLSLWKVEPITCVSTLVLSEMGSPAAFTKAEEMIRERMRLTTFGVTSFSFHPNQPKKILVPCNASLYVYDTVANTLIDSLATLPVPGAKIDFKVVPGGDDVVIFVIGENLYAADIAWDAPRIDFVGTGSAGAVGGRGAGALRYMALTSQGNGDVKCGVADYIMQEEFDRMTAHWPRPVNPTNVCPKGKKYAVLYTVTDETHLGRAAVIDPEGNVEQFAFPRPGTPNATTQLEVAFFDSIGGPVESARVSMPGLEKMFGFAVEYYPRMGWTPKGNVWVMALDRTQEKMCIVIVQLAAFGATTDDNLGSMVRVVHSENIPTAWYNVTDSYQFLNKSEEFFLCTSQSNVEQHMHITTVTARVPQQLTSGPWSVYNGTIKVIGDAAAYFVCNKNNMCGRVLYRIDVGMGEAVQMSPDGAYVHSYCVISDDTRSYAMVSSTLSTPPTFTFHSSSSTSKAGSPVTPPWSLATDTPSLVVPKIIFCTNQNGKTLPIALYTPTNITGPTTGLIVHVYGGPHVQTVVDEYGCTANARLQSFLALGYFVCLADNQAIFNNGLGYESVAKHKMGQFEVSDVEACARHVCSEEPRVDPCRIAVFG